MILNGIDVGLGEVIISNSSAKIYNVKTPIKRIDIYIVMTITIDLRFGHDKNLKNLIVWN